MPVAQRRLCSLTSTTSRCRSAIRSASAQRFAREEPPMSTSDEISAEQADALIRSRQFVALLVLAAVVGLLVSLAAWCFLEGIFQLQHELFVRLPPDLGYADGPPLWYLLVVLGAAGVIVAFAIARLPGRGGHVPVHGLAAGGPAT